MKAIVIIYHSHNVLYDIHSVSVDYRTLIVRRLLSQLLNQINYISYYKIRSNDKHIKRQIYNNPYQDQNITYINIHREIL